MNNNGDPKLVTKMDIFKHFKLHFHKCVMCIDTLPSKIHDLVIFAFFITY